MDIRRPGVTILIVAVLGSARVYAQAPPLPAAASMVTAKAETAAVDRDTRPVRVMVGRSAILNIGSPITRISLTSADIADALVTSPSELLLNGKAPGTISLYVWDRSGNTKHFEVTVQRDLSRLGDQIAQLLPGESIKAESNGKNVVLSGQVSNKDVIEKAVNLAAGYVEKKEEVLSLLQIRDGAPSNQVLLRVRFAEVARNAMTELGASWITSPIGIKNNTARLTTQQFAAPGFEDLAFTKANGDFGSEVTSASGKFTFSDFLNLFLFNSKYDIGAAVRALQSKGLFQSLAEPNLVSESGKEASFLAGGEFPVPIAQGGSAGAISVQYKEFGIRLTFTPVVTGNRIHLKVRPEVSTLDFGNAVVLNGFRIPALLTRRTETELELQNGQTFAIAGLMSNQVNSTLQKIPGIGDIPILGALFKSKQAQKQQTELVVMITPEILANNSSGVTTTLPRAIEPYMPPAVSKKGAEQPAPAFKSGATGVAAAPPVAPAPTATAAVTTKDPKTAAAAVTALTPNTRKVVNGDAAQPAAIATTPTAARPLTDAERKAFERAEKEERDRKAAEARGKLDSRVKLNDDKRTSKEAQNLAAKQGEQDRRRLEAERRQAEIDRQQQERTAREEAKREAADKKRQAELAKMQAELKAKQDEALAQAEARIKAAQAEHDAEAAKLQKAQSR